MAQQKRPGDAAKKLVDDAAKNPKIVTKPTAPPKR